MFPTSTASNSTQLKNNSTLLWRNIKLFIEIDEENFSAIDEESVGIQASYLLKTLEEVLDLVWCRTTLSRSGKGLFCRCPNPSPANPLLPYPHFVIATLRRASWRVGLFLGLMGYRPIPEAPEPPTQRA